MAPSEQTARVSSPVSGWLPAQSNRVLIPFLSGICADAQGEGSCFSYCAGRLPDGQLRSSDQGLVSFFLGHRLYSGWLL